jgi:polyisoprenoid-binding protein YceI
MYKHVLRSAFVAVFFLLLAAASPSQAADDYKFDTAHSSVSFKIPHLDISEVHGRFNDFSGAFSIDPDDAGKCTFELTIKTKSVDTNNKARDNHLQSGDFFDVKQFPTITFKSTGVKAIKDGYEVTGDLTLHGETKSITFELKGGKKAEFPRGTHRTGFKTNLKINRADYKMDKFANALGNEVTIDVSFEGTKK